MREKLNGFDCVDCKRDTFAINEYYMVHPVLWTKYGAETGMLCIGCLEKRLRRKLKRADFTDCPLNGLNTCASAYTKLFKQSPRLQRRLAA